MRKHIIRLASVAVLLILCVISAQSALYQVGPDHSYKKPSQVMSLVKNGDTVEIQMADYSADVGYWRADNLLIRGIGGRPHLKADGASAGQKAIWVVTGENTTIENIEFSGCKVADWNGAGIRQEGNNLTLRHCYFHDNEDGILGGGDSTSNLLFEYCEFNHNGHGDGYSHNMYITHIKSLTVRFCYSHHAFIGHNLKSRAESTFVMYNRIADESDGESSMQIDIPNGGFAIIEGNLIIEGPKSSNRNVITYGLENLINKDQHLYMVNNTIISRRSGTTYASLKDGSIAKMINNIFTGSDAESKSFVTGGTIETISNLQKTAIKDVLFRNESADDYHLQAASPAVWAGTDPGMANSIDLYPLFEYKHPADSIARTRRADPSVGAFEYSAPDEVAESKDFDLRISPNPVTRFCSIRINNIQAGALSLKVYDLNANLRLSKTINNIENVIDLGDLPNGCYIVTIDSGSQHKNKLVILEK